MKENGFNLDVLQTRFLLSKKLNGRQPITLESYRKVFMNFEHQLEEAINYDDLLQQTANFFIAINWYSDMAFNNQRAHMDGYFNYLVDEGILKENPIKVLKITRRKEEDKPRPTNREDLERLLMVISNYTYVGLRDRTMILLMADTGIRPAEATRLKWEHVKINKGLIHLPKSITKTKTERVTPISDNVKSYLAKLSDVTKSLWEDKELIFLTEHGEQMDTHVLRHNMKGYSEKAGVKITPYQLRHFFGTEYLRHDGNLLYLQKVMGHSKLDTTKKYIQVSEDDLLRSHKMVSPIRGIKPIRDRVSRENIEELIKE